MSDDRHEELLTTPQVGELLGFGKDWVRDQVLAGRLRADVYLHGERRRIRIRREAVEEFRKRYMETEG